MKRKMGILALAVVLVAFAGCTSYKMQPVPFKTPESYPNATEVAGAIVGAAAYGDRKEAKEAFGFDVRGAGMLPVQVVFDNQGSHALEIRGEQTFLEDETGNLWPILPREIAYDRATRYSQTKEIAKESAYGGLLGASAGALIGAAVGVVSGGNVASAAGKGAAAGGAAGAVLGGAKGYTSDEARYRIIDDLHQKTIQNKPIDPKSLAHGFLFFPGEADSARQLRLQLVEVETGTIHVLKLDL